MTEGKYRWLLCFQSLIRVQPYATSWTVSLQAPLSMRSPRQEYWSGLPFSSPGDPPDAGIEPVSPDSPALAGRFFTSEPPGKNTLTRKLYVSVRSSIIHHSQMVETASMFINRRINKENVIYSCSEILDMQKEMLIHATAQMSLDNIMLRQRSWERDWSQQTTYYMILFI